MEIETNQPQADVVFSADGKTLATGGYGKEAHVWGTDGKLLHALDCGGEGGLNPVFSPDGKVLAVGNRNHATNLFDPATGRRLHTLPAKMTHGLAFSPDGKRLAVGYVDGSVAIWGVEKGERLLSAKSTCQEVYSVAWSATGGVLATGGSHGKIELWDAEKLERVRELDGGDWVISARFSEDGTRLYTAGGESANPTNRKVTAWGLGDGK